MHLIFGAHPATKSLLAIKLFSQVTVRILMRIATNGTGKTWIPYEINNLKGSNYVNGVSIQKGCRKTSRFLTLQIATNHELKTVIYTSNDLWKSWSKVQILYRKRHNFIIFS